MGLDQRISGRTARRGVKGHGMAKRLRISQVIVPLTHDTEHVIKKACRLCGIRPEEVRRFEIVRVSLDARRKGEPTYVYTVDLIPEPGAKYRVSDSRVREITPVRYAPRVTGSEVLSAPIAVIGTGPAGLFCALLLAEHGYAPLVFERGKRVEERMADVERFWGGGKLDPESNVQFGEGGAGTFSDGKLATTVRDSRGRNRFILETFVRFGAPKDILYVSQPHIGTDVLRVVVANMREEIIRLGGRFFFSAGVRDIETASDADPDQTAAGAGLRLMALRTEGGDPVSPADCPERVEISAAVFAIGHSARDTFAMLRERGVAMVPKPFAVGMRVEHPQREIDRAQYGAYADRLPPAAYKLTYRAGNGRSVYSFCMCPGGYVINASSEEGRTAVNGMSERDRGSANANSAVIVSVTPDDFPDPSDPLSGIAFQRMLEERAFAAGNGRIPQQRFGDYARESADADPEEADRADPFPSRTRGGAVYTDLTGIFPAEIREAFVEGMHAFSHRIPDFDRKDVILSAVESRTSSPVCITRDAHFESSISGLYPCGEGAGYAGGITSAAIDGLKVAEALMARFAPRAGREDCGSVPGGTLPDEDPRE